MADPVRVEAVAWNVFSPAPQVYLLFTTTHFDAAAYVDAARSPQVPALAIVQSKSRVNAQ